jgi:uncharacterized protein (DUF58 family)
MPEGSYRHLPPHLADSLHGLSIAARRPMAGGTQGLHRSNRHGASVEFAEYRPYVPGDPPQLIDWSAYARTDHYLIRRFEEETNLTGYVALDCSGSLAWKGRGRLSKFDYACGVAASLLYILVSQGDRGGLLTFSDAIIERHAPAGSAARLKPMLEFLDAASATGKGDIASSLHQASEVLPRRSLVLVISDFLQSPREVLSGLKHLHHDGHDVRVIHILDRGELTLDASGLVELDDLESGERLEVDLDEIREVYRQAVDAHLEEIRRGCLGMISDYRLVHTDTPIAQALRGMA